MIFLSGALSVPPAILTVKQLIRFGWSKSRSRFLPFCFRLAFVPFVGGEPQPLLNSLLVFVLIAFLGAVRPKGRNAPFAKAEVMIPFLLIYSPFPANPLNDGAVLLILGFFLLPSLSPTKLYGLFATYNPPCFTVPSPSRCFRHPLHPSLLGSRRVDTLRTYHSCHQDSLAKTSDLHTPLKHNIPNAGRAALFFPSLVLFVIFFLRGACRILFAGLRRFTIRTLHPRISVP